MRAIIVEDSPLAREDLASMLKPYPELELVGEAENIDEAAKLLRELAPDLVFLDIHMPGGSGFDFLDALETDPAIVFVTAFSEHAIQSFDYNTVDYLIKPVHPRALKRAMGKVTRFLEGVAEEDKAPEPPVSAEALLDMDSRIFLRDGESCQFVALCDIVRFDVDGNYTQVHFRGGSCLIGKPLTQVANRLPPEKFFRANRQQLINIKHVDRVEPWINGGYRLTLLDGSEVTVSRRSCSAFSQLFGL